MKHCCNQMEFFLKEGKVSIFYDQRIRLYGIRLKESKNAIQKINFCPWCGAKLPVDLSDAFFSELSKALNKEASLFDLEVAPVEFKSDEWWKKRGL